MYKTLRNLTGPPLWVLLCKLSTLHDTIMSNNTDDIHFGSTLDETHNTSAVSSLRAVTGVAPWDLLYCRDCHPKQLGVLQDPKRPIYEWAVTLMCQSCCASWVVCSECSLLRRHIIGQDALHHHASLKHKTKLPQKQPLLKPPASESEAASECTVQWHGGASAGEWKIHT